MPYPEFKQLNLPAIADEVMSWWEKNEIFEKSVSGREANPVFTFYEGPPSANGLPGIHHVMARTMKDLFCRYKTLQGFQVKRKAGWDTHGLPIELGVEKSLGITKEDIGKTITVEAYNQACREDVMKFTDIWNDLTRKMGYWVDMDNPYITYENTYIETVWWLLSQLYTKGLLYKGYSIQPYSPAAGTGLSSHELNMPGTYKDVRDTTIVAQFKVLKNEQSTQLFGSAISENLNFLAWTTTPWTLPSNTALTVGKKINYSLVKTFNQYTYEPVCVILATALLGNFFPEKNAGLLLEDYKAGDKQIPYKIIENFSGAELAGIRYEQLLPYAQPAEGDAFKVILGDFVTIEDGTGIVHTAPSFGADDFKVAKLNGIGSLTLVDLQGRFVKEVNDPVFGFGHEFVKEQYLNDAEKAEELALQQTRLKHIIPNLEKYMSVDERIALKLKVEGKAFKIEKYEHTYPHCWRTDKPILYYPLDSWFIKTTAAKDRLIELNKTINWHPESTGTGRFGNWLENLQDWNLSRSRYWGIPIPIWTSADKTEQLCIGSAEHLKAEIAKSLSAGLMKSNPLEAFKPGDFSKDNYNSFDLHRPYADEIVLVSPTGKPMHREADLIDVWFDSGAMPYAQLHYPFENKELIDDRKAFPADYIAEGVDQTRGWFFTLHAIGVLCFDSIAFKNVISNGLVLDKDGNKMSKRLGNATDPFVTLTTYGPDATRWYMLGNAQPWDNLKFNVEGISEVQRKFFGTLYNTYAFFALYANIDNYKATGKTIIPVEDRPELDQWILSRLNSLIKLCTERLDDYDPTPVVRAIEDFVSEQLSNWYVRLSRRRFWKSDSSFDKQAAYETLNECLSVISRLISPVAPFFGEFLYRSLNQQGFTKTESNSDSVHLSNWPLFKTEIINTELEERMELAQKLTSMVLGLRKKVNIRVRQPLERMLVPALDTHIKLQLENVKELILSETNVKLLEFIDGNNELIQKRVKANFKTLGKKAGGKMKQIAEMISSFGNKELDMLQRDGQFPLFLDTEHPSTAFQLSLEDVEIYTEDIPGWLVGNDGSLSVALDISISESLKEEGLARELVNKIQTLRKTNGFEVTDRIVIILKNHPLLTAAVEKNKKYICAETLGESLTILNDGALSGGVLIELTEEISTEITIAKLI
jgi:isoleucyl-tRNA synthetase